MDYKKMITAYAKGGGDEKKMWETVDITAEAMNYIKEQNPGKHDCLMRKLSESLYGKHYSEELARADVEKMHHSGKDGVIHRGAHWSPEEVEAALSDKSINKSVTKWDKFVAANAFWHDLSNDFTDEQIICATYKFWFADEDWHSDGKIWDYMKII